MAIGACNAHLRNISGYLFILTGLAFLYSIYQTYMHTMRDDHYSKLCELNLTKSYSEEGLFNEFDNIPKTFAEDSNFLFALLIYQVSFIPFCLGVGIGPLCRFKPEKL